MKLSRDNYIAFCGFTLLSLVGLWFCTEPKIITPVRILAGACAVSAQMAQSGEHYQKRSGGGDSYWFGYTFTVAGTTYGGKGMFSHPPGETETIFYAPFDPNLNSPDLCERAGFDLFIGGFVVAVFCASLGMLIWHHCTAAATIAEAERQAAARQRLRYPGRTGQSG